MGVLDVEIVKGYIRMCTDGWLQGWHERNGGNLTYRMKDEEVAACRPFFNAVPGPWVQMGVQAENLAGEYFITTGSGKYFRNVSLTPSTASASWRSTRRATAGASSGAWRAAQSPPASSPATL